MQLFQSASIVYSCCCYKDKFCYHTIKKLDRKKTSRNNPLLGSKTSTYSVSIGIFAQQLLNTSEVNFIDLTWVVVSCTEKIAKNTSRYIINFYVWSLYYLQSLRYFDLLLQNTINLPLILLYLVLFISGDFSFWGYEQDFMLSFNYFIHRIPRISILSSLFQDFKLSFSLLSIDYLSDNFLSCLPMWLSNFLDCFG